MSVRKGLILAIFLNLCWVPHAKAKVFSNSYIRFELPSQWECRLQDTAWICRHRVAKACQRQPNHKKCQAQIQKSREALIVFTAKERGPVDSLKAYLEHMKEPKKLRTRSGQNTKSKLIHAKAVKIGERQWVDGMHLSSELPNYYTRYLSTLRGSIAVLVTFSAHKRYYTNHSSTFFAAIKSLQVTTSKLSKVKRQELGPRVLSRPIQLPDDLMANVDVIEEGAPGSGSSQWLFFAALILAALGIYIWIKGRRP